MSKARMIRTVIALLVAMLIPAQAALAAASLDSAPENTGRAANGGIIIVDSPPAATGEVRLSAEFFPDANFLAYLKTTPELRGVSEGAVIPQATLESVEKIACTRRNIRSLEGIQYFPNLHYLYCDNNSISDLNVSGNPAMSRLLLDGNPIERLTLSEENARNLMELNCWGSRLETVNLQELPGLMALVCGGQTTRNLNLSSSSLRSLAYYRGSQAELDLSRAPGIESLIWSETPVEEVDLSVCPNLHYLGLRKNELTVLDLSSNGDFTLLSAPENRLISVHGNPSVSYDQRIIDLGNQRAHTIGVSQESGSFDMAELDPDFARGTVSGLSAGEVNGSLLTGIRPGDTVKYTYSDGGLSVDATLNIAMGNYWTVPVQVIGWNVGESPNPPLGSPKYGTVTFTYGKPGGEFTATPPTEAGEWICRATVPGTESYGPLEDEVSFEITPASADVPIPDGLTGAYRSTLGSIELPSGYAWVTPGRLLVSDVGVHAFSAIYTTASGTQISVDLPVTIVPAYGPEECEVSPITNEEESKNIRVTDGTYTLVKGKDYTISWETEENLVSVTIHYEGNYYGTETRQFTYLMENSWIHPLSIENWAAGQTPSVPTATAKYGNPVFTYLVDGKYQPEPPTEPGTYTVRAEVPGTDQYEELIAEETFTVYPAAPPVSGLEATYGDKLSSVVLPSGFTWGTPDVPVGNVGTREFEATYTNGEAGYPETTVSLSVKVNPKNGELCDISPITNEYESKHIVIRDGGAVLTKGVDYDVDFTIDENVVTVLINFKGNYYGTVTRTFEFGVENKWVEAPHIDNWVAGDTPATPTAAAEYGEAVFTYRVDGQYQTEPPTEPGVYVLRAVVPATKYYPELTGDYAFRVYRAVAPEVEGLEAIYRDRLSDVELPEGLEWESPDVFVGNVGVNAFQATYEDPSRAEDSEYMGGEVSLDIAVSPKNGALCDVSPIDNEYESKHITITDGDYRLINGVDYTVSPSIRSNRVAVAINFENNYYNSVVDYFDFSFTNEWIEPVSIENWSYGEPVSEPQAAAKYGEPEFRYLVNGEYQTQAPTQAGTYVVEALVPDTVYYNGLISSAKFSVTPAVAPIPDNLSAVYRDRLSDVKLEAGYAWKNPGAYVGDVGKNVFDATYTPPKGSNYEGGDIRIPVFVNPKNGNLCSISPITNDYESSHIVITDGDYQLIPGLDYDVAITEEGNRAVVKISFRGNYYSSVTKSYSHGNENYWVIPLSMRSWREGEAPASPIAQARYGTPQFSYLVDGKYVAEKPSKAGEYFVRAVVPGTDAYKTLTDETNFEILPAQTVTPQPSGQPTATMTPGPTATAPPTYIPTQSPTAQPTGEPTTEPTEQPTQEPETPSLAVKEGKNAELEESSSGKILIGGAITADREGMQVRYAADLLTVVPQGANGTVRIVNPHGIMLTRDSLIFTGCKAQLVLPDGQIADEATIVVRGDVLGTGVVNISQLVRMARDLNGNEKLTWPFSLAAEFNDNDEVDISDLVAEASILNGSWVPM